MSGDRLLRLGFRLPRQRAELFVAELIDLAPNGFEEVEIDDQTVEYAVYGPPGELPELPPLEVAAAGGLVAVNCSEVPSGWQLRWREFHRPQPVVVPPDLPLPLGRDRRPLRGFWVRPPWAESPSDPSLRDLVVDPGMAFGTGAHPSTKIALSLLLAAAGLRAERPPVFDIGCGSGVLSLAAWELGYTQIVALDHDPKAVEATATNAAGAGAVIQAAVWDLYRDPLPAGIGGAVLLANLVEGLLLALAQRLVERPAVLICSGLLVGEGGAVGGAFAAHGLEVVRSAQEGGWEGLLLDAASDGREG